MALYAEVNADNTAIVKYPVLLSDYPVGQLKYDPPDPELLQHNLVLVRETTPDLVDDQKAVEGPPAKTARGRWVQTWIISRDTTKFDALKAEVLARVQSLAVDDWLQRSFRPAQAYVDAQAAVNAATTPQQLRAAIQPIETGLRIGR